MEEELLNNLRTFLRSAEVVYRTKDYTSATTLYFKTIFVALDLFLLRKIKIVPKDHSERFRLLEKSFPQEYSQLDKYFSVYRSTYSTITKKEICEEIRQYVISFLKEKLGI